MHALVARVYERIYVYVCACTTDAHTLFGTKHREMGSFSPPHSNKLSLEYSTSNMNWGRAHITFVGLFDSSLARDGENKREIAQTHGVTYAVVCRTVRSPCFALCVCVPQAQPRTRPHRRLPRKVKEATAHDIVTVAKRRSAEHG